MSEEKNVYAKQAVKKTLKLLACIYVLGSVVLYVSFQTKVFFPDVLSSKTITELKGEIAENRLTLLLENELVRIDKEDMKRLPLARLTLAFLDGATIGELGGILKSGVLAEDEPLYRITASLSRAAMYKTAMRYLNFLVILYLIVHFAKPALLDFLDKQVEAIKDSIRAAQQEKEDAETQLSNAQSKISGLDTIRGQHVEIAEKIGNKGAADITAESEAKYGKMDDLLEKHVHLEQRKCYLSLKELVVRQAIDNTVESLRKRKEVASFHDTMVNSFIDHLSE